MLEHCVNSWFIYYYFNCEQVLRFWGWGMILMEKNAYPFFFTIFWSTAAGIIGYGSGPVAAIPFGLKVAM